MTEDYMNYDSLSVAVKENIAAEMKDWYGAFGWKITNEYNDKLYVDIVHMDFIRPHKIENKDRLQLLQVRFEMTANVIAKANRKAKTGAGVTGVLLFLLGAAIIACGAVLALWTDKAMYIISGLIVIFAGILFWVLSIVLCINMHKYDKQRYTAYAGVLTENLRSIVKEAAAITGYSYGNTEQQKA